MSNNYKMICTDKHNIKPNEYIHVYFFETLKQAKHAKKCIEIGGNKARIIKVK